MEKIKIINYSPKAIVLTGDTKSFREDLIKINGRWNPYLKKDGEKIPGWIFPKNREKFVRGVVQNVPKPK